MRRVNCDYREEWVWQDVDYILMDPPWNYDDKPPSVRAQVSDKYSVWADEPLSGNGSEFAHCLFRCSLSVKAVFCWCTWSMLEDVVSVHAYSRYGELPDKFSLKTVITWIKLKNKGGVKFSLGHNMASLTAPLLVYRRNSAKALRLSLPNVFCEYAGPRTRKPKQFERQLVESLGGEWRYIFSGPDTSPFKGLDIDLVDKCHDLKAGCSHLFR